MRQDFIVNLQGKHAAFYEIQIRKCKCKIKNGEPPEKFEQRVKNANLRYGEVGELISYCIAIHF